MNERTEWNVCATEGCGSPTRNRTGKLCKPCLKRDWYRRNREHALAYNRRYYGARRDAEPGRELAR